MLKRITIVFTGLVAFSSIASATIAEDTSLIEQLNENLATVCADEASAACVDARSDISAAQSRIVVAQFINAAEDANLDVAIIAQLELLRSDPTSSLDDVIGLLATSASSSLASIVASVATSNPSILNVVVASVAVTAPQLVASVVTEVIEAVPSVAATVVQAVVAAAPSVAAHVVQAALLVAPEAADDILEVVANADLSDELQQQVAEVINDPSTASLGDIPTPS